MRFTTELLALSLAAGCPSSTDSDQAQYPQQPDYSYQAPQSSYSASGSYQQPQYPQPQYQPPQQQAQPPQYQPPAYQPQMHAQQLGIGVEPMTSELRTYFGAPADRGVLVTRVMPGSVAERSGVRVGDVVTEVNNKLVDNVRDLRRIMAANQAQTVDLQLIRQGQTIALQANLATETPSNPML